MSDEIPRHFAKGPARRMPRPPGPGAQGDPGQGNAPGPGNIQGPGQGQGRPEAVPPRLRESERLRERMRAQRLGAAEDLPPPPGRPEAPGRERRLPNWVVPTLLGVTAVLAAVGAVLLNRTDTPTATEQSSVETPLLSARRVPELIAAPVANARLQADLSAWVGQSPPNTCLAVQSGGETLFAQRATEPLAGASTQKLVTATAALLAMGPESRLDTVASTTAPPAAGVIAGDLYVVGGGDPILTTPAYAQQLYEDRQPSVATDPAKLVEAVKAAGITRIEGSVVGDGTRYDAERFHPRWPERYRSQNVVGQLGALMIDDGYSEFPVNWQGPGSRVPAGNAAEHAAGVVTRLLREGGVVVVGAPKSGTAPPGTTLTTVATLPSATVEEIVSEMLIESDNDTAEMLLKELGRSESGVGTSEAGAVAATALLSDAGVDMGGAEIVDGSGLSTDNRVSCQLLMGLITRPDTGPMLVEHSSVAGKTGTLLEGYEGTPIEGRLHAKTGTLNTVTALAGRVDPVQGGSLMFSYVVNDPTAVTGPKAKEWQRGLADILVGYPRGVDIAALLPVQAAAGEPAPDPPPVTAPADPAAATES